MTKSKSENIKTKLFQKSSSVRMNKPKGASHDQKLMTLAEWFGDDDATLIGKTLSVEDITIAIGKISTITLAERSFDQKRWNVVITLAPDAFKSWFERFDQPLKLFSVDADMPF